MNVDAASDLACISNEFQAFFFPEDCMLMHHSGITVKRGTCHRFDNESSLVLLTKDCSRGTLYFIFTVLACRQCNLVQVYPEVNSTVFSGICFQGSVYRMAEGCSGAEVGQAEGGTMRW